jgi:hypothetical protein
MLALTRLSGAAGNVGGGGPAYFGDRAVAIRNDTATSTAIDYFNITTTGNALVFGATANPWHNNSVTASGEGRGVWLGGYGTNNRRTNIVYVTIATTGNSTTFGDLLSPRMTGAGASDGVRGLVAGGRDSGPGSATGRYLTIEYITIATTGNSALFGNLTQRREYAGGVSNGVRGIFVAGSISEYGVSDVQRTNIIDYVTIATTGNAVDYGDYVDNDKAMSSSSNGIRGMFAGGYRGTSTTQKAATNQIGYLELNTTGNAVDFGDLIADSLDAGGTGNATRAVFITTASGSNRIQYVAYDTPGNAAAFGANTGVTGTGVATPLSGD